MKTFTKTLLALSLTSLFTVPAYAQETSADTQLESGEAEGEQVMERTREQERLRSGTGEAKMSGDKPAFQHRIRNQVRNTDQGEQSGELVQEREQEEKRLQSRQDPKSVQAKKQIRHENMYERQNGGSRMGGSGGGGGGKR